MLEDDATKAVLRGGQYEVILNTKFQLTIKNTAPQPAPQPAPEVTAEANVE
jgi:hypothetical protein